MPIHSPVAGIIEELLAEDGSTVQPGKVVLRIRVGATGGAAAPAAAVETPKPESSAPPPPPPPSTSESSQPAPMSSQPISDIKSATQSMASHQAGGETSSSSMGGSSSSSSRKETRVKINRMRQRIAQRLKDAQNTYAMLTTFNEIDMR